MSAVRRLIFVAAFLVAAVWTRAQSAQRDLFVTVNGLRLHVVETGDASPGRPAMILLHGIARHAHTFDHIAGDFSRTYRVLAVDMRGHGDSAWSPDGAYLVQDYVKDLEGLVDQLRLTRVTLLGNSTGGRVAQVYAGLHPDNVARLVVEDVGPERPQNIADAFARRVEQEKNGWTLIWKRDPNLVKGFIETALWDSVRRITAPTLYVIGGGSRIVPPETQQKLKDTLPDVRIVVMPGLGHYPDEENTAGFMNIVAEFLQT
jgi:pimeloyl-ACP methyl ester carboxylesterase